MAMSKIISRMIEQWAVRQILKRSDKSWFLESSDSPYFFGENMKKFQFSKNIIRYIYSVIFSIINLIFPLLEKCPHFCILLMA